MTGKSARHLPRSCSAVSVVCIAVAACCERHYMLIASLLLGGRSPTLSDWRACATFREAGEQGRSTKRISRDWIRPGGIWRRRSEPSLCSGCRGRSQPLLGKPPNGALMRTMASPSQIPCLICARSVLCMGNTLHDLFQEYRAGYAPEDHLTDDTKHHQAGVSGITTVPEVL